MAELQGGSALAGGVGAATGEIAAEKIYEHFYGNTAKDKLTEADKQTISDLASLAAGLASGVAGSSSAAEVVSAINASKNAVENNGLAHVLGAMQKENPGLGNRLETKADDELKALFNGDEEKINAYKEAKADALLQGIKDGGISAVDGMVETVLHPIDTVTNLVDAVVNYDKTFESIRVSAAEWNNLYNYALEHDAALAGEMAGSLQGNLIGNAGMGFVVSGAAAKMVQKVAQLKTGAASGAIKDFIKDETGSVPGKGTNAGKGNAVDSSIKISTGVTVGDFEKGLVRLPPGERVAIVKDTATKVATANGLVKDNALTKINNRDVYRGSDGNLYALDTQHGRFEVVGPKGKHLGEVDFSFQKIPNSIDKSGGHNLKVK